MAKRAKLPLETRRAVLLEAAYRCGNPRCGVVLTLEVHHIEPVSEGGGNDASNLLPLCPNCHSRHDSGLIPPEAIRLWKGMLVALGHSFDRESMDLLLLLNDGQWRELRYSGDGVLRFARLISAGLVQRHGKAGGGNLVAGTWIPHSWQLELTERGQLLVEAWLLGDEQRYRELVSAPRDGCPHSAPDGHTVS